MQSINPHPVPFWKEDYTKPPFYTPEVPFWLSHHTRPAGSSFSHVHVGFEVAIVLGGDGRVINAGSSFDVHEGDSYFFDCMIPHGLESAGTLEIVVAHTRALSLLSVYPSQGDLRILHPFFALRKGIAPVIPEALSIQRYLTNARTYFTKKNPYWELVTWIQIAAAFAEISQYETISDHVTDDVELEKLLVVQKAVEYMHRNLLEKITLQSIAQHCNLSPSRFSHMFTETMNISPIRYWNQLRIQYAAEKILQTNDKLTTIAFDFGFSSFSQFFTLFKKTFGYAPSYLRKDSGKT